MEKTVYMEKLAIALQLPMIKLVDGSSGGGSVTTIRKTQWSYVPPLPNWAEVVKQLNAGIPNLGAVLGPAVGLGAARAAACHFSVMAADVGALFNAGPQVVASKLLNQLWHGKYAHMSRRDVRRRLIIWRAWRPRNALYKWYNRQPCGE